MAKKKFLVEDKNSKLTNFVSPDGKHRVNVKNKDIPAEDLDQLEPGVEVILNVWKRVWKPKFVEIVKEGDEVDD